MSAQTITINRFKLYPTAGRSYRAAWKWCYTYSIDGAPAVEYGPGLADLRSVLRRKHAGATLIETWRGVSA